MLFHVHFLLAVAGQNCHYSVVLLQHFTEFVHHRYLMFVQAVRIAIQRDIHALVPKYFGQRFHSIPHSNALVVKVCRRL